MSRHAVVLGGGGFIGSAITRRLLECGWDVTVAGLGAQAMEQELAALGAGVHSYPRADSVKLLESVGDHTDALVDVIAYRSEDARQLELLAGRIGTLVVISSGAVYAGPSGRSLFGNYQTADHIAPVRLTEAHPTVAPDDSYYGGGKAAVEATLRAVHIAPTTIIRPFAVFGPFSTAAREWYFFKRILDRRRMIILSNRGHEKFNRCSVGNLAEIVRLACEHPGDRIVNAADDDPYDVIDIARGIADLLDWKWSEILLPGPPPAPSIGYTPWSVPTRIEAEMSQAGKELCYRALISPETTLEQTIAWLSEYASGPCRWEDLLPGYLARNGNGTFSYDAEANFIRTLADPGDALGNQVGE